MGRLRDMRPMVCNSSVPITLVLMSSLGQALLMVTRL